MAEIKFAHIQGKNYVDINATIQLAKKSLETNNSITLVARQTQISRIGIIIKSIEQSCNCKVTEYKTVNKIQSVKDKQGDKQVNVLYLRVTLQKN